MALVQVLEATLSPNTDTIIAAQQELEKAARNNLVRQL